MLPWERQPGESARAFAAFAAYRDLGVSRSIDKAWRAHQPIPARTRDTRARHWQAWSRRWGWVERAADWDREIDRQTRDQTRSEGFAARNRHATLAQASLSVLFAPVRAALEAVEDVLPRLVAQVQTDPEAFLRLLALVIRAASVMPGLVTVEREALGLSADDVAIPPAAPDWSLANRITADPAAVDLAIALLDRLAGTDRTPSTRAGPRG